MKSNVFNACKYGFNILPFLFLSIIFSWNVIGQELKCNSDEKKCNCDGVDFCCKGLARCYPDKNPKNRCSSPDTLSKYLDTINSDDMVMAAYFTFVKDEELTNEVVTKNKRILEMDTELIESLERGELKTNSNEKPITFTPFGKATEIIKQYKVEDNFLDRERLDGVDKAIKEYKKNLGSPNSTPIQSNFFLSFGKDLVRKNRVFDAIKIFGLDVEINKSQESQTELNNAQLKLADIFININQERNAKKTLKKILDDKKASTETITKASEKLTQIKKP